MITYSRAQRQAKELRDEEKAAKHIAAVAGRVAIQEEVKEEKKNLRIHLDAEERANQIRATRQGFGVQRTFELVTERPGWHRRWVNDVNIPFRLEQGWTFVSKSQVQDTTSLGFEGVDVADRITKPNKARNDDGQAGMTTLMEIPQVIAAEIQKAMVDDPADRIDDTIRGGTVGLSERDRQYTYIPRDTPIRMSNKP
jgi:hypothetical protein